MIIIFVNLRLACLLIMFWWSYSWVVTTDHWISQFLCFRSSSLLHISLNRLWMPHQPILQQKETKGTKFSWWLVSILHLAVENVAIRLERLGCLRVFCDVPPSNFWFLSCFIAPNLIKLLYVIYHRGKAWEIRKRERNCHQIHDWTQVKKFIEFSEWMQCSLMCFFFFK